jgi:glycosyltransferase involved in cell wall biosynthesis
MMSADADLDDPRRVGMPKPPSTNVLYVTHDTGLIGGAERQLLELFRGLDRQRFMPYLVCLEEGGPVAERAAGYGVPVFHVTRRWRWDLSVATRIRGIIRERAITIVHAYLGLPGFYGAMAGKLAGARVITTIRIAGPRRRASDVTERFAFLISDRIIANSRAGAEYYFRWLPGMGKTEIIYNGYDFSDFDPAPTKTRQELGLPPEGLLIGHVANLTYLKDYPTFIRALAHVFAEEAGCRAAIVGDGAKRADYESLADALGVKDRILFLGHRRDVLDLVRSFDICVLASHPGYSEGLSNSIAEYMGLAKPVVATEVGGNPELVKDGETGLLCPGGDHDAMAGRILALLKDEQLRHDMGRQGREFFKANLTLDRMVNDTQKVYEELASK